MDVNEIRNLLPTDFRLLNGDDGGKPKKPRAKRKGRTPEGEVLNSVLSYLKKAPSVGWSHRMNAGAVKVGNRFMKFGFTGLSDVIGQMKDGRFLAVEVKAPKGKPTQAQLDFIETVNSNGGLAGVVWSINDLEELLNENIQG